PRCTAKPSKAGVPKAFRSRSHQTRKGNTPVANSAEWKPIPLVASVNQRYANTSVDNLLTNAYLQKDGAGATWVRRRAGFTLNRTSPGGGFQGVAILERLGGLAGTVASYTRLSGGGLDVVYENGVLAYTYVTHTANGWLNQSTVVTLPQVYTSNGTEAAYQSGGGAFTKITDVNYPPVTLNGSAFLNGFLYVLDPNGSVWGTPNQNDFSIWSSTNVVNAWGTVGQAVAIRKYLNEVLVFKTFTVEVF